MAGRVRVLVAVPALFVALVAALLGQLLVLPAPAGHAVSHVSGPSGRASPSDRVVLIGVPGLRWGDVTEDSTPTLWRLAGEGSAGSLTVRTVRSLTCPADGWLTISAGNRADLAGNECAMPPEPDRSGEGAIVPGFAAIRRTNGDTPYASRIGLLGDAVRRAGGCTAAFGPGAALAAAGTDGRVDAYRRSLTQATPADWSRCPLTAVDVDHIARAYLRAGVDAEAEGEQALTEEQRAAAVRQADRALADILRSLPPDTTVLLAGVSEVTPPSHLHVAIAAGPGPTGEPYRSTYLTASSTRRPNIVQLTDVTPTALAALGIPVPAPAVGSSWRPGERHGGPTDAVVRELSGQDVAAQTMRVAVPPFYVMLVVGQLVLYGIAVAALRRRWYGVARLQALAWTRRLALACAAVPVASFLANLVPWWRTGQPMPALAGAVAAADVAVVLLALYGPWRRYLLGPITLVAGVTGLVLAVDVLTGSWLQLSSLMGYSPVIGGRFYGFGNPPYALFAAGTLLAAAGLAEWQRRRGRPRAAVAVVTALGIAAVAVDGWPTWGSDVGGVIALTPGLALLGLVVAGRRVTLTQLLLFSAAGAAVVAAIGYVDYLRPPDSRSHLGWFVEDLVSGNAGTVILRKVTAMLGTLGNVWLTLLVPFAVAFLVFVLNRPERWRAPALRLAFERAPMLRPGLLAVLITSVVGFAVNDSGIAVPAVAAMLTVPLALAAGIGALELDEAEPSPTPRA
ncbi:MAG: hypothetical protein GEV03_16740 [Streptosporangiales bacterium]|nr:hypothetical protein [Streptosporangiales bacterium]